MSATEPELLATDDGSFTVFDPSLNESYHSRFGARSESTQVFLRNSLVSQRLIQGKPTAILEIGFGTGYNFTCTAQLAVDADCALNYTAVEMRPLPPGLILQVLQKNKTDEALCQFAASALEHIRDRASESHSTFMEKVQLSLLKADARQYPYPPDSYDAIYLDAFSTKNNPALWESAFLINLKQSLHRDGRLATYCVNRRFRDALTDAGWRWQKLPGPKGKREVLVATPTAPDRP